MKWIKKNPELAIGIGLPLLLAFFFVLAGSIPKLWVEPPKYDLLYLTNYSNYNSSVPTGGLHYEVYDGKVSFTMVNGYNGSKLYRYIASTGVVKEITFPVIKPAENPKPAVSGAVPPAPTSVDLLVPEVENLHIDTSAVAPDGYQFHSGYESSPNLMMPFFFSSSYRNAGIISKNGNVISMLSNDPANYYMNIAFIGWVVP